MKFEQIEQYILRTREDRRKHLILTEACIEIGGDSRQFRGLLAYHLMTTMPNGMKIHLCHACNNGKCSNVNHLYWGTASDNGKDAVKAGNRKGWKLSAEKRIEISRKGGLANIGRKKYISEEKKQLAIKIIEEEPKIRGWVVKVADKLNVSHTTIRRFVKRFDIQASIAER